MTTPVYFCEHISGILWRQGDHLGLTLPPLAPPPDATRIQHGDLVLRYGIEMLTAPYQLIPGYFENENGAIKTGRAAWEFIWSKFQLYPRAEVIGFRSDGAPAQVLMRDLDFGEPPKVLAFPDETAWRALGVITHLSAPPDATLPDLLAQYAPNLRR